MSDFTNPTRTVLANNGNAGLAIFPKLNAAFALLIILCAVCIFAYLAWLAVPTKGPDGFRLADGISIAVSALGIVVTIATFCWNKKNDHIEPRDNEKLLKYIDRVAAGKYAIAYSLIYMASYGLTGFAQQAILKSAYPGGTSGKDVPWYLNCFQSASMIIIVLLTSCFLFAVYAGSPNRRSRVLARKAVFLGWVPPAILGAASLTSISPDLWSVVTDNGIQVDICLIPVPGFPQVQLLNFWLIHRVLMLPLVSTIGALVMFLAIRSHQPNRN